MFIVADLVSLNTISNGNSSLFMQTISSYLVKISVNVVNYCTIITWYKIVIAHHLTERNNPVNENRTKGSGDMEPTRNPLTLSLGSRGMCSAHCLTERNV